MAGWNAAVEFSQVALHSAPNTLNVVAHAKVSCRVVIGFSGVAKPLHAIVTRMSIRDKMAASSYPYLKEQFNAILLGVEDNLQPQAPGVYFYTAHDNGLLAAFAMALLAEPCFIDRQPRQKAVHRRLAAGAGESGHTTDGWWYSLVLLLYEHYQDSRRACQAISKQKSCR